jgi:prepilin-type N-terminal cleavage/methylation domain-containing protein
VRGFTLIELIVTTAILSLILLMAMQVTESTRNSIRIAESRSNNDAIARQVFDRISHDISHMQAGAFARIEFNTNNGNDEIAFLCSSPGLTDEGKPGKRGISQIHYSITDEANQGGKLIRGMRGYDFDDTLTLDPEEDFTDVLPDNQIVASENVIRLEVEYLVQEIDQTGSDDPKVTISRETKAPETTENLRGMVVTLVTVDVWTRRALKPERLQEISRRFPDAAKETPTFEAWSRIRDEFSRSGLPGYPLQALQNIRCYQRTILTP